VAGLYRQTPMNETQMGRTNERTPAICEHMKAKIVLEESISEEIDVIRTYCGYMWADPHIAYELVPSFELCGYERGDNSYISIIHTV